MRNLEIYDKYQDRFSFSEEEIQESIKHLEEKRDAWFLEGCPNNPAATIAAQGAPRASRAHAIERLIKMSEEYKYITSEEFEASLLMLDKMNENDKVSITGNNNVVAIGSGSIAAGGKVIFNPTHDSVIMRD
jgi:hypothetical protein